MAPFLYIFNPDHDLSLANGDPNYMPPAPARLLAEDLALLPMWYASQEDRVLAPSYYNLDFLKAMTLRFNDLPSLLTDPEVKTMEGITPSPWGWDPAMRKRLHLLGIPDCGLPGAQQMILIRKYSHRSFAVELLARLQQRDSYCGESFYYTRMDEVKLFVESRAACLLKAPLSGSGKGLNWCKGVFTPHILHWSENILKQQGGVVAEPLYDKVVDFAMQFHVDASGKVAFSGYSLFRTNAGGAYEGNILASGEEIEKQLGQYVDISAIRNLQSVLEEQLAEKLKGVYQGYFGIDMMICRFPASPEYRVHPCVEINLRMTMGMTARLFYDRYVQPGAVGMYRVGYFPSAQALWAEHDRLTKQYPLRVQDRRIVSGYMPLVPITPKAQYSAWVLI